MRRPPLPAATALAAAVAGLALLSGLVAPIMAWIAVWITGAHAVAFLDALKGRFSCL